MFNSVKMTKRVNIPFALAHIIVWTFYYNPLCISYNPDHILVFQKYHRNFNRSADTHWSKSKIQENVNKGQVEAFKKLIPNINGDISLSKQNSVGNLPFPNFELLHKNSSLPQNSHDHLTRKRRSDNSNSAISEADSHFGDALARSVI